MLSSSQMPLSAKAAMLGLLLLARPDMLHEARAAEAWRAGLGSPGLGSPGLGSQRPAPVSEVLTLRLAHMDGTIRSLPARLTRPARDGAFPAVVLVPDALGLDQRLSALGEELLAEGWATLEVDLDPVSTDGHARPGPGLLETQADAAKLVGDLALVLELLGEDRGIDTRRIAVVGLGTGGRAALLAGSEAAMSHELGTFSMRFAAHAAFYPGCEALMAEGFAAPVPWSTAPVAVFHAGEDGRNSRGQCGALRDRLAALGRAPAVWHEYPRAFYGWDLGHVLGTGPGVLANLGTGRVGVAADVHVAEDATERLVRFLRHALASSHVGQ